MGCPPLLPLLLTTPPRQGCHYWCVSCCQDDGGFIVFVNGVKIHQNAKGDVVVTSGPKTIRVSPIYGSMYVETHFVEMAIEMNWNIKVRRGGHRIHASFIGFILTDGFRECGFDQYRQVGRHVTSAVV